MLEQLTEASAEMAFSAAEDETLRLPSSTRPRDRLVTAPEVDQL